MWKDEDLTLLVMRVRKLSEYEKCYEFSSNWNLMNISVSCSSVSLVHIFIFLSFCVWHFDVVRTDFDFDEWKRKFVSYASKIQNSSLDRYEMSKQFFQSWMNNMNAVCLNISQVVEINMNSRQSSKNEWILDHKNFIISHVVSLVWIRPI